MSDIRGRPVSGSGRLFSSVLALLAWAGAVAAWAYGLLLFLDTRADFIERWVPGLARGEIGALFPRLTGLPGDFAALPAEATQDLQISAALGAEAAQLWEYCHRGAGGCFHAVFDRAETAAAVIPAPVSDLASLGTEVMAAAIGPDWPWSLAFLATALAAWWGRPGIGIICAGTAVLFGVFLALTLVAASGSEFAILWTGSALGWAAFQAFCAALFLFWGALLGRLGRGLWAVSGPGA